jgi:hypothetical protein
LANAGLASGRSAMCSFLLSLTGCDGYHLSI